MNTIKLGALACSIALFIGCSDNSKQPSASKSNKDTSTSEQPHYPKSTDSAKMPSYLEQNWTHETRMEWWYTSQGSRILPYDWFLALERPDNKELVSSKENLEQFRFISWSADAKWNPDGLPIGFVADKDTASGTRYLGVNCSTCHTGKIAYKGKEYIVEGAPAHHDFNRFTTELALSMQKTLDNSDKFSRFANHILGTDAKPEQLAALKTQLSQESSKLGERIKVNQMQHPNGYARLDAFGEIFNEATVFAINEPTNKKLVEAPVSYPVLWDTPQHDVVQWNGAAVNAGIGPYARNAGEVVGVFGDLKIAKVDVAGKPEMRFNNHININNLGRLEAILTTLWSPLWPEQMLPAIDQTKAQRGKPLFDTNCVSCHQAIKRDDPARKVEAKLIPVTEVGTDSMASNILTHISKTGMLEGQPIFPLTAPPLPKFEQQSQSVQVVLYGVVGVLRDGLDPVTFEKGVPAFLAAAKKNTIKENCDPHKEGAKCLLPLRYKARPLNGIWASAPFLHNGSVPNLWELLQKPEKRVTTFNVGNWEFDPVNVGFVTTPESATSKFDTTISGNSNKGHAYGTELTDQEKWDLIEYIKTL